MGKQLITSMFQTKQKMYIILVMADDAKTEFADQDEYKMDYQIASRIQSNAFAQMIRFGETPSYKEAAGRVLLSMTIDGHQFESPAKTIKNILKTDFAAVEEKLPGLTEALEEEEKRDAPQNKKKKSKKTEPETTGNETQKKVSAGAFVNVFQGLPNQTANKTRLESALRAQNEHKEARENANASAPKPPTGRMEKLISDAAKLQEKPAIKKEEVQESKKAMEKSETPAPKKTVQAPMPAAKEQNSVTKVQPVESAEEEEKRLEQENAGRMIRMIMTIEPDQNMVNCIAERQTLGTSMEQLVIKYDRSEDEIYDHFANAEYALGIMLLTDEERHKREEKEQTLEKTNAGKIQKMIARFVPDPTMRRCVWEYKIQGVPVDQLVARYGFSEEEITTAIEQATTGIAKLQEMKKEIAGELQNDPKKPAKPVETKTSVQKEDEKESVSEPDEPEIEEINSVAEMKEEQPETSVQNEPDESEKVEEVEGLESPENRHSSGNAPFVIPDDDEEKNEQPEEDVTDADSHQGEPEQPVSDTDVVNENSEQDTEEPEGNEKPDIEAESEDVKESDEPAITPDPNQENKEQKQNIVQLLMEEAEKQEADEAEQAEEIAQENAKEDEETESGSKTETEPAEEKPHAFQKRPQPKKQDDAAEDKASETAEEDSESEPAVNQEPAADPQQKIEKHGFFGRFLPKNKVKEVENVKQKVQQTVAQKVPSAPNTKEERGQAEENLNEKPGLLLCHTHHVTLKKKYGSAMTGVYEFYVWPIEVVEMYPNKIPTMIFVYVKAPTGEVVCKVSEGSAKYVTIGIDKKQFNVFGFWDNGRFISDVSSINKTSSIYDKEEYIEQADPDMAEDAMLDAFRSPKMPQKPDFFVVPFERVNHGLKNIPIAVFARINGKCYVIETPGTSQNSKSFSYKGEKSEITGHWENEQFHFDITTMEQDD